MIKILYAASENENAKIQLARFMKAMKGKPFIVKIAAFKKSSPPIHIDWTLDSLKNMFKPEHVTLDNPNFNTYYSQVKYFNPDLIISDLEYFTCHIASVLGVTLWQCSSSIINHALSSDYKYNLGIFKRYAYQFSKNKFHVQRIVNILDNSNRNFVYSHFGDTIHPPELHGKFEWIRPYHQVGKRTPLCQHNVVAGAYRNNKKILSLLKQYPDSVCFTEFLEEYYDEPALKDIGNVEEFACNLRNSELFVCEGQSSFLADAFYNGKFTATLTNFEDPECIINSTISEKLNLSKTIYQIRDSLAPLMNKDIPIHLNKNIKLLHEKIEEL